MKSRVQFKFPTPWKTLIIKFPPPRDSKGVKCPGYARGGVCWSFDLTDTLHTIQGVTTSNTHLSFRVWCSITVSCRRQLFKRWIMLHPSRQNIVQWIVQLVFLINTYPLNLVNSLVIHLLNNLELLCSIWVKMVVGKLACTCWLYSKFFIEIIWPPLNTPE